MQKSRARPLLLMGLLSLGAATALERLACSDLPTDLLEGFFDGLGVTTLMAICWHVARVGCGHRSGPDSCPV